MAIRRDVGWPKTACPVSGKQWLEADISTDRAFARGKPDTFSLHHLS
jgi:hypothetical protein